MPRVDDGAEELVTGSSDKHAGAERLSPAQRGRVVHANAAVDLVVQANLLVWCILTAR